MRRSRLEDVLNVLNEMRYSFFRSGGSASIEQLWREAVRAITEREANRFKNRRSAENCIRDACTRRLRDVEDVYDFKRMAAEWLNGTSDSMRRAVFLEVRSDRERSLFTKFFGILSGSPENKSVAVAAAKRRVDANLFRQYRRRYDGVKAEREGPRGDDS